MPTTLEQLGADIRRSLAADPGPEGKTAVRKLVSAALVDRAFVARHLTAEQCQPRKVLYEDAELGFCICGHVYDKPATGGPHDHGPTWAIYGLAVGTTVMTDWRIVKPGAGDAPALVEPVRHYELKPGDCHFYDVGKVHSPKFEGLTKLLRVEAATSITSNARTSRPPEPVPRNRAVAAAVRSARQRVLNPWHVTLADLPARRLRRGGRNAAWLWGLL